MSTLFLILCSLAFVPRSCASRDMAPIRVIQNRKTIEEKDLLQSHMMMKLTNIHENVKRNKGNDRILQQNTSCYDKGYLLQNCFGSISTGTCNDECAWNVIKNIQISQNYQIANNGTLNCDNFTAAVCSSIASCGCATCEKEFSDYYNNCGQKTCLFQCGFTPSPTPAPTQQIKCPDELAAAQACVQKLKNYCDECIVDAHDAIFANDDNVFCYEFSNGICSAIKNECACENCGKELEDYYRCLYECSKLDCDIEPEPPSSSTAPKTGVIIGVFGGVFVLVGIIIVGKILLSRRNRPNHTNPNNVPTSYVDTSHDEIAFNTATTPEQRFHYGSSSANSNSPEPYCYSPNSDPVPNHSNVLSGTNGTIAIQGDGDVGRLAEQQNRINHQPNNNDSISDSNIVHTNQPASSMPDLSRKTNVWHVIGSGTSVHTSTPSKRKSYIPSYKDQCRSAVVENPIVEATPLPNDALMTSTSVNSTLSCASEDPCVLS